WASTRNIIRGIAPRRRRLRCHRKPGKTLDHFWIHHVIVCFYLPVKIVVSVTPKKNVLDPQGAAVGHALESLGFRGLKSTRIGKPVELEVEPADTPEFRAQLDRICRDLLSNPIIEDYHYEILKG